MCWVTKCYDGDTIHVIRIIGKKAYRVKCRLLGIDTAEIRSDDMDEKDFALQTRDWLRDRIYNQYIWVSFSDFGKYGRALCTLYTSKNNVRSGSSVNQLMIDQKYALPYDGGTKVHMGDWVRKKKPQDVLESD